MTVSTTSNRKTYTGDGVSTVFAFPYKFITTSDIVVYVNGILQTTGYTVGTPSDSGANITFSVAPANLATIVILSDPARTQSTSLPSTGPFPAKSVETMVDKLTLMVQRLYDLIGRSLTLADGDATTASTVLPSPQASALIGWDSAGTSLIDVPVASLGTTIVANTWLVDKFNGTGAQTAFTLTANPGNTYATLVSVSGVVQVPGVNYTISGTTLTFLTGAPASGSSNVVVQYGQSVATLSNADASALTYSPSGAGAATRTVQSKLRDVVSVKDFGAAVDGATDDTVAYQAALNAARMVTIPAGTMISSNVTVPSNTTVRGAGRNATTIRQKASTNLDGHTVNNANDVEFIDLTLDGNSGSNLSAGNGVLISGTSSRVRFLNARATNWRLAGIAASSGTSWVEALNCRIDSNLFDGFQMTTVAQPSIVNCDVESNGRYGAVFGSACTNVRDFGNIYKSNAQGGSIMVGGNDAVRLGNIADTNGTGHGLQYNGTVRGVYVGNISKLNGISGLDFTLGSSYGVALGNVSYGNTIRGIEIDSASYYTSCIGNMVFRNGEAGISVYRSPAALLLGNYASENGTVGAAKYGIRIWDDVGTLPSNNVRVIGNNATDDRGGSATQTHGISIEGGSTTGVVLEANKLDTNVTAAVTGVTGGIIRARDNSGFVTQNEGTSSIAAASTSVTINHGLSITPSWEAFSFTLTSGPANAVDQLWVSSITATQFTVNIRTAPGAGGLNFRWRVNAL